MEGEPVASSSRPLSTPPTAAPKRKRRRRNYDVEDRTTKTDVGSAPGTCWTLSSYKPGSGVAELRSPDLTKLWQSDGNQPHLINIQFSRRTCVTHVSIYLDVKQDDSYTPTKIAIKAGTNYHDLTLVRQRTFDAPQGWKHFSMMPGSVDAATNEEQEQDDDSAAIQEDSDAYERQDEGDDEEDGEGTDGAEGIRVWLLQVCILANHLNGKDTHIRRLIVFGPKSSNATGTNPHNPLKRGPASRLAHPATAPKPRTALTPNLAGQSITLAQLLSVQAQADAENGASEEDGSGANSPPRRSALSLFGNIR